MDTTDLFLCEDDPTKQLVLQTLHSDSEVYDGGTGRDLRCVGGVWQLGGDVQVEPCHHVHLFVTNFYLWDDTHFAE